MRSRSRLILSRLSWMLKQALPLTYVSTFGEGGGRKVCVWRMWLGRCFSIRTWTVTA
jgi:hypothetical protein